MRYRIIHCQKCDTPLFMFDEEKTGKITFGNIRCKSCLGSFRGKMGIMFKQSATCTACGKEITAYSDIPITNDTFEKSVEYFNNADGVNLFCSKMCYKLSKLKE